MDYLSDCLIHKTDSAVQTWVGAKTLHSFIVHLQYIYRMDRKPPYPLFLTTWFCMCVPCAFEHCETRTLCVSSVSACTSVRSKLGRGAVICRSLRLYICEVEIPWNVLTFPVSVVGAFFRKLLAICLSRRKCSYKAVENFPRSTTILQLNKLSVWYIISTDWLNSA